MIAYQRWLKSQLRLLEHPEPDLQHFYDLADIIRQASKRAAVEGLPVAVQACNTVRPGPIGPKQCREILAACLAACPAEPEPVQDDLLTVAQAAEQFGIPLRTIYDLCNSGQLRHSRIGAGKGRVKIKPIDFQAYLKSVRQ